MCRNCRLHKLALDTVGDIFVTHDLAAYLTSRLMCRNRDIEPAVNTVPGSRRWSHGREQNRKPPDVNLSKSGGNTSCFPIFPP